MSSEPGMHSAQFNAGASHYIGTYGNPETPPQTLLRTADGSYRWAIDIGRPWFSETGDYAGMVGAVLSDFLLIGAVALGLGALLAASEFWFSVVKWVGVAYLAYLGLRLLRSSGSLALPSDESEGFAPSRRTVFLRSLLVAVTNIHRMPTNIRSPTTFSLIY